MKITTFPQLRNWLDSSLDATRHDETRDTTIQFGFCDTTTGKATLTILKADKPVAEISTFFWKELVFIRDLVKFGSNYAQKPCRMYEMIMEITATLYLLNLDKNNDPEKFLKENANVSAR
jgi:hypothetical protein